MPLRKENQPLPRIFPRWEVTTRGIGEIFFRLATQKVEVSGRKNLPEDLGRTGYIFASNHSGWAEFLVAYKVFPNSGVFWMTRNLTLQNPIAGPLLRRLGAFPVKRGEVDRQAIQTARDLLDVGKIVGIFPAGTRGRGESVHGMKKAKKGAVYIARLARVPIIPVAIQGPDRLCPLVDEGILTLENLADLVLRRVEIKAQIGSLFKRHLEEKPPAMSEREYNERLTMELMLAIREMLPLEYHGVYAGIESSVFRK